MDNFIVSARKYRPATFVSVVGQAHITSTLKNAIARNQLAHAYLFTGPRGVGKTTCARIFAKAINCQSPVDSEACGQCESCRSFDEGRSFNIHELDAASNNSVDDIRTLTEQVRIPPQIGKYSVYIIDEVHMLSQAAFNAFLKTLEEPPAHAVFILATTEKHKIIPTILSRCQIYDFNRIRVEDSVGYLKYIASEEAVEFDDESLNLIAQKADGGMRDALSMFDKAVAFCGKRLDFHEVARTLNVLDYDTYFTLTNIIREGDYKGALLVFDDVLKKGFSGQTFIAGLNAHFRDLLMCKDPNTLPLLEVTGSLLEKYRRQSAEMDITFLFNAISLLSGIDSTFKTATNQRLHVELGLMKLCGLGQKKNSLEPEDAPLPELRKAAPAAAAQPQSGNTANATPAGQAGTSNAVARPADEIKTSEVNIPVAGTTPPRQPEAIQTHPEPATQQPDPVTIPADVKAEAIPAHGTEATAPKGVPEMPFAKPEATAAPASKPKSKTVSGVSINDILKNNGTSKASPDTAAPNQKEEPVDPESEQKILAAKDEFVEALNRQRPRFATAFSLMNVAGNVVSLSVANELLKEDIVQNQKDIFALLRKISGLTGAVELNIEVKEDKTAVRPIKPEDKLAHLRAKNPTLDLLRKELDLEVD